MNRAKNNRHDVGARAPRAGLRSGFTLVETVIALVIFSVLGYGLAIAAEVGKSSQITVSRIATENHALREATSSLANDLCSTSDANIAIAALADGNHRVRFMVPIDDAGVATWGVSDRRLGHTLATQNRASWLLQYTVKNVAVSAGVVDKQLVRQIVDAAFVVQREDVIAHGLRLGTAVPPGFQVVKTGAMWEVTLSTEGPLDASFGNRTVIHVKTRN
ncbi:MAG TPA: type II secretion system protein [Planctomycetota bacterium]|nr:type II secretion system protein [Planctomycetota bacterium]